MSKDKNIFCGNDWRIGCIVNRCISLSRRQEMNIEYYKSITKKQDKEQEKQGDKK